jgi:hypothetical protein
MSHQLDDIKKELTDLDKKIKDTFEKGITDFRMPDFMPSDWGKARISVNFPIDHVTVDALKLMVERISGDITKRKELRDKQARIMMAEGMIKVQETIPE